MMLPSATSACHETLHGEDGRQFEAELPESGRAELTYEMPLAEVIFDFSTTRFQIRTQGTVVRL